MLLAMIREIFAILLMSLVASAAIDQSYIQTVSRNGASSVEKTMEIAVFSNQLATEGLAKMADYCEKKSDINCSVDVEAKRIVITENFASGGYYVFSSEYGIPSITHTITISRVPTDRFSNSLARLLVAANATEYSGSGGSAKSIDLSDTEGNAEAASVLKTLKANITYIVVMPTGVSEAKAGSVIGGISGQRASFDLLEVMSAQGGPIVVKSQELNYGYLIAIAGVVVLGALALSFAGTRPSRRKK
jgi:hypothetical protein